MTDINGYLKKLDEIGNISSQKNRQERDEHEFKQRELVRKRAFRQARKVYNERKVLDSKGKEIKGDISDSDYALSRYLVGELSRGDLNYKSVEKLFGKDYAKEHFYVPDFGWQEKDTDRSKKVTNEEIGENRALVQSIAYTLMENGHLTAAIKGAKLYAKLGKGKQAIPKLVERAERAVERSPQDLNERNVRYMKMFVKKHGRERHSSSSGLEGKTVVFVLSTLAGIALSIFSFNATGNAVADITGTSQGLLGILLFVVGIAGMFFNVKK